MKVFFFFFFFFFSAMIAVVQYQYSPRKLCLAIRTGFTQFKLIKPPSQCLSISQALSTPPFSVLLVLIISGVPHSDMQSPCPCQSIAWHPGKEGELLTCSDHHTLQTWSHSDQNGRHWKDAPWLLRPGSERAGSFQFWVLRLPRSSPATMLEGSPGWHREAGRGLQTLPYWVPLSAAPWEPSSPPRSRHPLPPPPPRPPSSTPSASSILSLRSTGKQAHQSINTHSTCLSLGLHLEGNTANH